MLLMMLPRLFAACDVDCDAVPVALDLMTIAVLKFVWLCGGGEKEEGHIMVAIIALSPSPTTS